MQDSRKGVVHNGLSGTLRRFARRGIHVGTLFPSRCCPRVAARPARRLEIPVSYWGPRSSRCSSEAFPADDTADYGVQEPQSGLCRLFSCDSEVSRTGTAGTRGAALPPFCPQVCGDGGDGDFAPLATQSASIKDANTMIDESWACTGGRHGASRTSHGIGFVFQFEGSPGPRKVQKDYVSSSGCPKWGSVDATIFEFVRWARTARMLLVYKPGRPWCVIPLPSARRTMGAPTPSCRIRSSRSLVATVGWETFVSSSGSSTESSHSVRQSYGPADLYPSSSARTNRGRCIPCRLASPGINLEAVENTMILRALRKFNCNQSRASRQLDLSRKPLNL